MTLIIDNLLASCWHWHPVYNKAIRCGGQSFEDTLCLIFLLQKKTSSSNRVKQYGCEWHVKSACRNKFVSRSSGKDTVAKTVLVRWLWPVLLISCLYLVFGSGVHLEYTVGGKVGPTMYASVRTVAAFSWQLHFLAQKFFFIIRCMHGPVRTCITVFHMLDSWESLRKRV